MLGNEVLVDRPHAFTERRDIGFVDLHALGLEFLDRGSAHFGG